MLLVVCMAQMFLEVVSVTGDFHLCIQAVPVHYLLREEGISIFPRVWPYLLIFIRVV